MMSPIRSLSLVIALAAMCPGQFEANQASSSLSIGGVTTTGTVAALTVKEQCTSTLFQASSVAASLGLPFDIGISQFDLVPAGPGQTTGLFTSGGQRVNLDLARPLSFLGGPVPGTLNWSGPLSVPLNAGVPATLSVQMFVTDPAEADGVALSQACQWTVVNSEPIVFTTPFIIPLNPGGASVPGSVGRIETVAGNPPEELVSGIQGTAAGIEQDVFGNTWYGIVNYQPFQIELMRRDPSGALTSFGFVVDETTSGGNYSPFPSPYVFRLASDSVGQIYYTSPSFVGATTITQPGNISVLDPTNGTSSILIPNLSDPCALDVDSNGEVFFGDAFAFPFRVNGFRFTGGSVVSLGNLFTSAAGFVLFPTFVDIARRGANELVFTVPQVVGMTSSTILSSGEVRSLDLTTSQVTTLATGYLNVGGLAVDSNNEILFGDWRTTPVQVDLYRLDALNIATLVATSIVDTSPGAIAIGGWGFDIDVACP